MLLHSLTSPRLPLLTLAVLLAACGDDGGTSATAGTSNSSTGSGNSTGDPSGSPTTVDPSNVTDEPTAGSMSQSGTSDSTTVDPTATSTSTSTSTTSQTSSTTDPVQTATGTTIADTTIADTTIADTGTGTGTSTTGDASSSSTGDTNNVEPCACPDLEVALDDGIFVLSDNSELWKFYPETKQFEMLGAFNCGGMTNTFSMAVDRLGFAWIMFNNPQGEIWKLDVTNVAKCTDPGYNPGQQGISYFGMAYVSNSAEDVCDHLYGNSFDGFGGFAEGPNIGDFITVDTDTQILTKLGKTNFNGAELTGTGDGRAFMFGGVNPAKLVEVNKANGQFIDILPLPGLNLTNAFAFAFFAGDFYMFTESNNPLVSKVTHLDYDDSDNNGKQDLTTIVNAAPIRIVGAGVSTCAPFAPQ